MQAQVRGEDSNPQSVGLIVGEPYSLEEQAVLAAGMKTAEQGIATQNEFLQRLLTLDAALIGGGFVVAKGDVLPYSWGVAVLVCLLASLVTTLWGLVPTEAAINVYGPGGIDAYRRFEVRLTKKKKRATWIASGALAVAFAVGVVGMATKESPPTAPASIPAAK